MVAFPLLQFAICYIGAYLSQNALYKFLEEDMDQAHGQNSYVSDWKTYDWQKRTCKSYNLYELDATYWNNLNNITTLAPIHPAYVLLNKICMLNINKNLPWNCLIDHYQCQSQWPNRLICHFFLEEHDNISWITNITFYYQADDWTLTLALMYEVSCENFLQNHRLTVHGHGYLGHLYFLLDMNVRELFQHDVHLQSFSC